MYHKRDSEGIMKRIAPVIIILLVGVLLYDFFIITNEDGSVTSASLYQLAIWKVQDTIAASNKPTYNHSEVYVVDGGDIYHYRSNCSGMKEPIRLPLGKARQLKYKPCEKCVNYERP